MSGSFLFFNSHAKTSLDIGCKLLEFIMFALFEFEGFVQGGIDFLSP